MQSLQERAAATTAWLELSGPLYGDSHVRVVEIYPKRVVVFHMEAREKWSLLSGEVSLASWYILQQSEPGEIVSIKFRCDSVSTNK